MKTPICEVCMKSGILCPSCQKKLDRGEVSEIDVKIARTLYKAMDRNKGLRDITFEKSLEVNGLAIMVVGEDDVQAFMGKGSEVVEEISDRIDMDVRVLGSMAEPRAVADDLIRPARILGVNTVYSVDGTRKYKIRVAEEDKEKMSLDLDQLQELIKDLTGQEINIVFE